MDIDTSFADENIKNKIQKQEENEELCIPSTENLSSIKEEMREYITSMNEENYGDPKTSPDYAGKMINNSKQFLLFDAPE